MSEATLPSVKQWQRNRALLLHREFSALAARVQTEGVFPTRALKKLAKELKGVVVQAGVKVSRRSGVQERIMKKLKVSYGTLVREWYRWNSGADGECTKCSPEALLLNYKAGIPRIPDLLVSEIQRRCTLKMGGRDKDGLAPISVVYQCLKSDFAEGKPIPGINLEDYPAGAEFPYSESTIRSYAPAPAARALGNRGVAAFKARACHVTMDYSKLRKCELFTLDDARLDLLCIHDATGRAIIVRIYVLMEVASRMIVAFLIKPMDAIRQEDVEELLAHGLQTPGFGIGKGYTTYIKFERGATPCSEAAQEVLEKMTNGGIQVIRTGMNGGITWVGAPRDVASGNAAGKAVIESFIRRLHYALLHLPGQIGNNWQNTPASVGFGQRPKANPLALTKDDPRYGTLVVESEKLATFAVAVRARTGKRLKLQLPMLYLSQLQWAVHEAIDKLNHEPGHEYADHGEFVQAEVEPGVWKDVTNLKSANGQNGNGAAVAVAPVTSVQRATPNVEVGAGKTYTLNGAAKPLTIAQRNGMYWRLWKAAAAAQPDLNRFALTSRALGRVIKIAQMTDEQFLKICHVFESIAKKGGAQ
jgi:hypothetical protein